MRYAISADEHTPLVDFVRNYLSARGHEVVYFGPAAGSDAGPEHDWSLVSVQAARAVASGAADEAVVMCWTGTGATLAANKVRGVRAALVHDAPTAAGARKWNHANVLGLSLRATPPAIAEEILDAWFDTPFTDDEWNVTQIARIADLEAAARGT